MLRIEEDPEHKWRLAMIVHDRGQSPTVLWIAGEPSAQSGNDVRGGLAAQESVLFGGD